MASCAAVKVMTFALCVGVYGMAMATFIVTAPKRGRYDTTTTFSVSGTNVQSSAEIVDLLLRTGDASEVVLNETRLVFSRDGVQTWSVVIDSNRMMQLQQYSVQLRAEYAGFAKVMDIPMNPSSGHVMIQTDKVIYSPGQTVMYRVIALDDDQQFASWPVTVDVKNPDLIILERRHHSSVDAFTGRNFTLPRDATKGKWSITAYYDGTQVRTRRTVEFEVLEYVLPTVKVEVSAEEKVIAPPTNWVRVNTKAEYSWGQPVHGTVQLRLGVARTDRIALFNISYQDTLNESGTSSIVVPVADMRHHSAWFPDGTRLYLEATVTESGTGETATAATMDTFFANPFYRISFNKSKKYFKPGFDYTLVVDVEAANGDPAAGISIYVIVEMKTATGVTISGRGGSFSSTFQLNQDGRWVERIMVHEDATACNIRVYTLDPKVPDFSWAEHTVARYESTVNEYLHLSFDKNTNLVNISFTPLPQIFVGSPPLITILIMSKGRVVHSDSLPRNSMGSSLYPLSVNLRRLLAPSARVVAYFYLDGSVTELVTDSLFIDSLHWCREEISLSHSVHLHLQPKNSTELWVSGGGNMRVGLLAVDRAVYFLRDQRSLSRQKVFSMLGEADEGRGIGDGRDAEKIFEFAGLQYEKLTATMDTVVPVVLASFDISRLNAFIPQTRRGNTLQHDARGSEEEIPLEQVRKYFPESWLFKELTLSERGFVAENITLPDSITTWVFTAVGVGASGGVCMSAPVELTAFKPFFTQVRLPYRAVRLEEVNIDIGIYNYKPFDINVTVTVRGELGLCFSEGSGGQTQVRYAATLRASQTNSETVRVIPLVAGDVQLTVDVRSNNGLERDIVQKSLYVVAEGRRVEKTITFPLDPSGQHSSHQPGNRPGVHRTNTATVSNRINKYALKQLTDIRLYMPREVIHGSEKCQISACGDLMGDIINVAVVKGDNLFESSVLDAEEVIGNLAPAVHALLYLNQSGFMTPEVEVKGRAHVTHGVSRLLNYRKLRGSFSLTPESQPATWLTALVLKTLCHAEGVTFVDHDALVDDGFAWLLDQVQRNGSLTEQDRRLARPSLEYDLMLSAETLIALHECAPARPFRADDQILMERQQELLKGNINNITSPLVMAKTAYALTLFNPYSSATNRAVRKLRDMSRTNIIGHRYWAETVESESPRRPFWYHSGTRASAIEATAYALLVFHHQNKSREEYEIDDPYEMEVEFAMEGEDENYGEDMLEESEVGVPDWGISLDSIAGWLIQKRNSRGAFIGAMDTVVASQALSLYSLSKQGLQEINLHCNVTTSPMRNYTHSFDFNEDNAIKPKSLSNVPVGRLLKVETRGTGLGQMQVRVEYNVPVEANAQCHYNVSITRRILSFSRFHTYGDAVCQYCNMGCDHDISSSSASRSRSSYDQYDDLQRVKRQITSSRVSICIEVCVRSAEGADSDRTIMEVEMLTGYQPVKQDLQRIIDQNERYSLSGLYYDDERTLIEMKFNQIPHDRSTCVSFRATERVQVARRNPAIVTLRPHDEPEPTCVHTYAPVVSETNLAVYCASNQTSNQGQCRCFSGQCGRCHTQIDDVSLGEVVDLTCDSEYIYKIRQPSSSMSSDWVDFTAQVVSTPKNGSTPVESEIKMVAPRSCTCPHRAGFNSDHLYFFGSNIDIFVDRNNRRKKTYLLDHTTAFVSPRFLGDSNADRTGDYIAMAMGRRCRD